ncbi:MAG TPA: MarR family winged helix-turn-helix transcriptional regulator [Jiangellaceae bacterium]
MTDTSELTPAARLSAQAWESLFRAQVALMRRFQRDDIWIEVSLREYDVLFTLSLCPDRQLRLGELNQHVLLSQPSLSRLVERLEARGLLRREPSPDDGRGTVVALTDEGLRLQREIGRRHVRTIDRYVGGALSEAELRRLAELCDALRLAQPDIPDRSSGHS